LTALPGLRIGQEFLKPYCPDSSLVLEFSILGLAPMDGELGRYVFFSLLLPPRLEACREENGVL
jgi:hypothetical protein